MYPVQKAKNFLSNQAIWHEFRALTSIVTKYQYTYQVNLFGNLDTFYFKIVIEY